MKLKVLQIGAGSMGTRRIRDLASREDVEIALYDERKDRREVAGSRFGIPCFASIEEGLDWKPDLFIISTPPDQHRQYVELAYSYGCHHFCEADIWPYDYLPAETAYKDKGIIGAPSCTFYFSPVIQELRRIVQTELSDLHAYQMVLSADLNQWHPGEGNEYYARNRETSAAREMVPFELIGLIHAFGQPIELTGTLSRQGNLEAPSEDTWCLQMKLDNGGTGHLSVMMGCPHVLRKGWAAGNNGIVQFDVLSGEIVRDLPKLGLHDTRRLSEWRSIGEKVYFEEINTFIDAVQGHAQWPFDYRLSSIGAGALAAAEKSAISGRVEKVDPGILPARLPDLY